MAHLCIEYAPPTFAGDIVYLSQPTAEIADIDVTVTPLNTDPCLKGTRTIPVEDNHFEYTLCTETETYRIQPDKTTEPNCGLDAQDIYDLNAHLKGTAILQEAHHRIAADVSGNGVITQYDKTLLHNHIVKNLPFSPVWDFVADDEYYLDNYPGVPIFDNKVEGIYLDPVDNQLDFAIVKMGDVNGTCLYEEPPCCVNDLIFDVPALSLSPNQVFDLPLKTYQFTKMQAFQMGLSFDPDELEFVSVLPGDLKDGSNSANWDLDDAATGSLRMLWYHDDGLGTGTSPDTTLSNGRSVFYLRFKALTSISNTANALSIDNSQLAGRAFTNNAEYSVVLQQELTGGRSSDETNPSKKLFKAPECFPNPVTTEWTIQMQLVEAAAVKVQIHDTTGRLMEKKECLLEPGLQQLRFKDTTRWPNGLYHYTIEVSGEQYHGSFVKTQNE